MKTLTIKRITARAKEIVDEVLGDKFDQVDILNLMNTGHNMDELEFAALGFLMGVGRSLEGDE